MDPIKFEKYKKCLQDLRDQTSIAGGHPWEYNEDLFPHIPNFSSKALREQLEKGSKDGGGYTYMALPSIRFSGVYHSIRMRTTPTTNTTTADFLIQYMQGFLHEQKNILWRDEALEW
jgi:hypothetical protein